MLKCIECGRFTSHNKESCGEMTCNYNCRTCNITYPVIRRMEVLVVPKGEELKA